MFYSLTNGTQLKQMIGKSGIVWAMDGDVPIMLFYIVNDDEISLIDAEKPFRFSVKKVDNVLFVCTKCGDTPWYSAPLNPHSTEDYMYDKYDRNVGKIVELYVVNSRTGYIEKTGALFLTPEFSKGLEDMMKELEKEEFDASAYEANIRKAYETYKTDEELTKDADLTCKIN